MSTLVNTMIFFCFVTGFSPICPPCDNEMKTDTMLEHMCASEFGKYLPAYTLVQQAVLVKVRYSMGLYTVGVEKGTKTNGLYHRIFGVLNSG